MVLPFAFPLAFPLAFLFVFFASIAPADAQTLDVAHEGSLPRVGADGSLVPKRPLSLAPEAINGDDCRDDVRIRVPLEMTGFQPVTVVEAWASTIGDCSLMANRVGEDAPCWNVVAAIPLQQTIDVDIPVRALLSKEGDASTCRSVDFMFVDLQFLMFPPGDRSTPVAKKTITLTADTVGPLAPEVTITPGNGRALLEVSKATPMAGVASVVAYCEPSASPTACTGTALVPGGEPDPAHECGSIVGEVNDVGDVGARFSTSPIPNGTNEVVAVAARDAFGNLGPLSSLVCTTPSEAAEPNADEGGGCATSGGRGARVPLVAFAIVAFALRRRRGVRHCVQTTYRTSGPTSTSP